MAVMLATGMFLILFLVIIAFLLFIFWLASLIDCLKREFKGTEKLVWVIVLIFLNLLGAIIYYFVAKPNFGKLGKILKWIFIIFVILLIVFVIVSFFISAAVPSSITRVS